MKSKAQMNWEVGKEQEEKFIDWFSANHRDSQTFDIKQLFAQIRQNEYRRGKEEERNRVLKIVSKFEEEHQIPDDDGEPAISFDYNDIVSLLSELKDAFESKEVKNE